MLFKIPWAIRAILYKLFFGSLGSFSYLGAPLFLKGTKRIYIGKRVRIYPHYRMETYGDGKIVIEENCSIGQRLHITATNTLVIGSGTTISFDVMITDIDHEYRKIGVPIADQSFIGSITKIGSNCFIGSGAKIQAGTKLGKQCIVGANSVVRGSFPDYSVIVGSPAKVIKKYNFETDQWERTSRD